MNIHLARSFAAFKAERVAVACQAYIDARAQRIAAEREQLIDAEMRRRWFRPRTRQEAEDQLKADGRWYDVLRTSAYWFCCVEDLLALARLAGEGDVFVCAEDAATIAGFMAPDQ